MDTLTGYTISDRDAPHNSITHTRVRQVHTSMCESHKMHIIITFAHQVSLPHKHILYTCEGWYEGWCENV